MASRENEVFKACLLRAGKLYPAARIFRQNVGTGWTGPGFNLRPGQTYTAQGGERVLTQPRLVEFGLVKGSGDGIGWNTITITPDMVGRKIAVFTSLETKSRAGRATKEQLNWHQQVQAAGGIALIINDADQLTLELPPLQ